MYPLHVNLKLNCVLKHFNGIITNMYFYLNFGWPFIPDFLVFLIDELMFQ